jgi:hypothetical protein
MIQQSNDMNWVSLKLLSYTDPETVGTMCMHIEGGMSVNFEGRTNYISPRLKISIRNPKIVNADIHIELHYPEIIQLKSLLDKNHFNDITLYKYYQKSRKDLHLNIINDSLDDDNTAYVLMTIKDPSSSKTGEMSTYINVPVARAFKSIITELCSSYIMISSNMIGNALMESIRDSRSHQQIKSDVVDVKPQTYKQPIGDFMSDFNEKDIRLVGEETAPKYTPPPKKKKLSEKNKKNSELVVDDVKEKMPFFGHLTNKKPEMLTQLVHGFINCTDKSDKKLVNILKYIISSIDKDSVMDDVRINHLENLLGYMYKNNVKKYLTQFEFDRYPVPKLPNDIVNKLFVDDKDVNDPLYCLSAEICYVYALYTIMTQKYISNVSIFDDTNSYVSSMKTVYNFMRMIMLTIPLSIPNRDKIEENLFNSVMPAMEENGYLDEICKEYNKQVPGGNISINRMTVEKILETFVASFDKIETMTLEDFIVKYNEGVPNENATFDDDNVNQKPVTKDVIKEDEEDTIIINEIDENYELNSDVVDNKNDDEYEVVENLEELLFGSDEQ